MRRKLLGTTVCCVKNRNRRLYEANNTLKSSDSRRMAPFEQHHFSGVARAELEDGRNLRDVVFSVAIEGDQDIVGLDLQTPQPEEHRPLAPKVCRRPDDVHFDVFSGQAELFKYLRAPSGRKIVHDEPAACSAIPALLTIALNSVRNSTRMRSSFRHAVRKTYMTWPILHGRRTGCDRQPGRR